MDKYIIITKQDFLDWDSDKVKNHLYKIYEVTEEVVGTDEIGVLKFNTIPALFSSKTVYTKSQIDER